MRHIHQAKKPEILTPRMLATPARRPLLASWPMALKRNFLSWRPSA